MSEEEVMLASLFSDVKVKAVEKLIIFGKADVGNHSVRKARFSTVGF